MTTVGASTMKTSKQSANADADVAAFAQTFMPLGGSDSGLKDPVEAGSEVRNLKVSLSHDDLWTKPGW